MKKHEKSIDKMMESAREEGMDDDIVEGIKKLCKEGLKK